ncbi:MAG: hypothetical protein AW07_04126 [Candidatus Accumulibacter sp. SK-11]|nr:MAG: hypothetical protein AW07_04126 [Candidatus Accumulibacter sp. SK-11]
MVYRRTQLVLLHQNGPARRDFCQQSVRVTRMSGYPVESANAPL